MIVLTTDRFMNSAGANAEPFRSAIAQLTDPAQLLRLNGFLTRAFKSQSRRVYADLRTVDRRSVLVLLESVEIAGIDDQHLKSDHNAARALRLEGPSDDDLRSHLAELDDQLAGPAVPLPDEFYAWLNPPPVLAATEGNDSTDGTTVHESRFWESSIEVPSVQQDLTRTALLVTGLAYATPGEYRVMGRHGWEVRPGGDDTSAPHVIFRWIQVEQPTRQRVLFLLAVTSGAPAEEQWDSWLAATSALSQHEASALAPIDTIDSISRLAARAYPLFLFADERAWREMHVRGSDSVEGALALSAEELTYLMNVGRDPEAMPPIFLNGRAGSGKSTMLAYLFATYMGQKIGHGLGGSIAYLATNSQLLEQSQRVARDLLASQTNWGISRELLATELSGSFLTYRQFLKDLLPPHERVLFDDAREMTFGRFKHKLERSPQLLGPGLDPETAWFVIRSIIKGHGSSVLGAEWRDSIPQRDRIVANATIDLVLESVWRTWYRDIADDGWWDDQDLARAALNNLVQTEVDTSGLCALFCDEAQDFTRLELRVLLNASSLTRFAVDKSFNPVFPFAFAGDPLQTINPTGFRWGRLQAMFKEVFEDKLPDFASLKLSLHEFEYNYRSSWSIVRLLNSIQLFRKCQCGLRDVGSQRPWRDDSGQRPVKVIFENDLQLQALETYFSDNPIVLIPAADGQPKYDYIASDPLLRRLFPNASPDNPPTNLLTPEEAKGLQFTSVVLYRFGESFPAELAESASKPGLWADEPRLATEFALNRLYVAASRAEEALFVLDSTTGDERFWRQFGVDDWAETKERCLLGTGDDPDSWEDTDPLEPAPDTVLHGLGEVDFRTLAHSFDREGRSSRDPLLMRLAARNFEKVGELEQAKASDAFALWFERRFQEAGDQLLSLGRFGPAWDAYREGVEVQGLLRWSEVAPAGQRELHVDDLAAARYLGARPNTIEAARGLLSHLQRMMATRSYDKRQLAGDQIWGRVGRRLERELVGAIDLDEAQIEAAVYLADLLSSVALRLAAAEVAYSNGEFRFAVGIWEDVEAVDSDHYAIAKAEMEGFPGGLRHLAEAGLSAEVVDRWDSAGRPLTAEWARYVVRALDATGSVLEAVRLGVEVGEPDVASLLQAWFQREVPPPRRGRAQRVPASPETVAAVDYACRLLLLDVGSDVADMLRAAVRRADPLSVRRATVSRMTFLLLGTRPAVRSQSEVNELRDLCEAYLQGKRREAETLLESLVAGAAMELAGRSLRLTQVLAHYKDLAARSRRAEEANTERLAWERWLAVKQVQLSDAIEKVEAADGSGDAAARESAMRQRVSIERSLRATQKEHRISADISDPESWLEVLRNMSSSVVQSPAEAGTPTPPRATVDVGRLRVQAVPGRVLITERETLQAWSVSLRDETVQTVGGDPLALGAAPVVVGDEVVLALEFPKERSVPRILVRDQRSAVERWIDVPGDS